EVIDGTTLDGELAQKEVDHLNWIMDVNKLLTDDTIHELNVQTDHTKCGFGKWLYGEGRKQAEALVPTLAPLFKEIEEPHLHLHESAITINEAYAEADPGLPGFLAVIEVKHLQWAASIQDAMLNNAEKVVAQTDHTHCGFGKWLYSKEAEKTAQSDPDLARLLQEIKDPHQKLHGTAKNIIAAYQQVHPGLLDTLRQRLDDHRKWASMVAGSLIKGSIITVETDPAKCGFGQWLGSEEATKLMDSNPTLNKMLTAVKKPHDALHASAVLINNALNNGDKDLAESIFENKTQAYLEQVAKLIDQAIKYENILMEGRNKAIEIFKNETTPELGNTQKLLKKLSARAEELLMGKEKAADIYANQTAPNLVKTQKLLDKLRKEAANNILTDKAMLAAAQGTKRNVAIVSVIAILAGVFLAF
ncbi:MAG: methyl-accepting chemotaxis protein, partial [Desulfobacteraceae bacterium]|nr:methyl-accepting chemotaxis protein [Desulfobacteraceae bacterium]